MVARRTPRAACSASPREGNAFRLYRRPTGPLCPAAVVDAARILPLSHTLSLLLRNTAISGTIIDFDTSSHARMHTAAAFQTRSRRDRKKLSPTTLNDDYHFCNATSKLNTNRTPMTLLNRYMMQRCTISCLRDPR